MLICALFLDLRDILEAQSCKDDQTTMQTNYEVTSERYKDDQTTTQTNYEVTNDMLKGKIQHLRANDYE